MIKVYKKDGQKYFEVYVMERGREGKQLAKRKRGITTEKEAREIEYQFKAELRSYKNSNSVTWEIWHERLIERYSMVFRASTVANYDGYLKKYIPKSWLKKDLRDIKKSDVFAMLDSSKERLGSTSQKNILKMIRKVFNDAIAEGLAEVNPAMGITVKSRQIIKKVLTSKEVDILLKEAKESRHEFYPVWAFAVFTGMRSGEMYALKWSDVDFDTKLISVSRQWTSKDGTHELKTGDWRVVPISQDLGELLHGIRVAGPSGPHDFVLPRINMWMRGNQAAVLRDFCGMIGITSVKFHDLRATFITNMLAQGVSLVKVMAIVGHKKMETTDEYLRLAGVEIKGATEALGYSLPEEVSTENVISVDFKRK
ncbi:tyrosine-type recombinase/integrase [Bdellovibrio sp. HCB290]|uniref:tyrosine-type recombinase/integrase n=1 Tax=Bdellovibrio sp. HCB290 TaxID=3394356 RepID=UPI0039B45590